MSVREILSEEEIVAAVDETIHHREAAAEDFTFFYHSAAIKTVVKNLRMRYISSPASFVAALLFIGYRLGRLVATRELTQTGIEL